MLITQWLVAAWCQHMRKNFEKFSPFYVFLDLKLPRPITVLVEVFHGVIN